MTHLPSVQCQILRILPQVVVTHQDRVEPVLRVSSPPADLPPTGWKIGSILVANTADWAGFAGYSVS
jgi:hypothetical protein